MANMALELTVKACDLKVVKDLIFLLEKYKTDLPVAVLNQIELILDEKGRPTERDLMLSIVNDVANVGVDFGYGEFFIDDSCIERARGVINAIENENT